MMVLAGGSWRLVAQPTIAASNYSLTMTFNVAPGQLVTLIVTGLSGNLRQSVRAPAGADLPNSLAGIGGGYAQLGVIEPADAVLEVHPYSGCGSWAVPYCTQLAAVTIQIPFEAVCDLCVRNGGVSIGSIGVHEGQSQGSFVWVRTATDQVHILTTCDAFLIPDQVGDPTTATGLPCPSVVTHLDGSSVSAASPTQAGEELIAYAVGLGRTNPPLQTGKLVTAAASTETTYGLDFNYHPNALASKPLPGAPQPLYAGATPGYVGLYQINFAIPTPPAGTLPCGQPSRPEPGRNIVYSNLTVSVGGTFSFDGARICVAVPGQ